MVKITPALVLRKEIKEANTQYLSCVRHPRDLTDVISFSKHRRFWYITLVSYLRKPGLRKSNLLKHQNFFPKSHVLCILPPRRHLRTSSFVGCWHLPGSGVGHCVGPAAEPAASRKGLRMKADGHSGEHTARELRRSDSVKAQRFAQGWKWPP